MDTEPSIPAPLPVIGIIRDAFQYVWDKRTRLLRALAVVMIALVVLEVILYFVSGDSASPNTTQNRLTRPEMVLALIALPIYILFAITCHRLALVGDSGVAAYGNLGWGKRELRFLGWCVMVSLAYALLIMLLPITFQIMQFNRALQDSGQFPSDLADSFWYKNVMYVLFLPSIYLIARFSPVFPATAVDRQVNMKWAWNLTKKNGLRLTVVVGILPWVFTYFQGLLLRENATLAEELTIALIGLIFLAVEVVALSFSYKHLTETEGKPIAPPASGH